MTLTEAAFWTKRFGVIFLVFLAISSIIILIIFRPTDTGIPPEYLQGNFACTETKDEFLENTLTIPSLDVSTESEMAFNLQTETGKYENLPSVVNVYRYTDLGQRLNSQADAKVLAKKMGFDPEKIVRKGTTDYIWVNNSTQKSLQISARDLNFVLKTEVSKIRSIRKEADLPSEGEAVSLATNALRSLGILDTEYTKLHKVFLIDINPDGSYSEADSLINAELIRVDFLKKVPLITIPSNIVGAEDMVKTLERKDMTYEMGTQVVNDERIDVYNFSTLLTYQNPLKSNISVYVGPRDRDSEVLQEIYQIEFKTWSLEVEYCGTYPLITPSTALQRIQNGEGSLVFLNVNNDEVEQYIPQNVKEFNVMDIYITYYEGLFEQQYLQPVYMVEGQAVLADGTEADFHIYYPAISYETLGDKIELEKAPVKESGGFLP